MAKIRIRKCKKCGGYTDHIYKGKEPIPKDEIFMNGMLGLATGGLWLIFAAIFDDRPTFWECSKCGKIHKIRG